MNGNDGQQLVPESKPAARTDAPLFASPTDLKSKSGFWNKIMNALERHWFKLAALLIGALFGNIDRMAVAIRTLYPADSKPTYYSYYNDFSSGSYTATETLSFKSVDLQHGIKEVTGSSSGDVRDGLSNLIKKRWKEHGFETSDRLVYSYFTETPKGQGAGVFYLRLRGNDWVGYWIGRDQVTGGTILGPCVLSDQYFSPDAVTNRFPELREPAKLVPWVGGQP